MNLESESELGDTYISFIYGSISFYRLKITCKLCVPVHLEVRGISHGRLFQLTLKTRLNTNLANIFNCTLNKGILLEFQQANCVCYLLHH